MNEKTNLTISLGLKILLAVLLTQSQLFGQQQESSNQQKLPAYTAINPADLPPPLKAEYVHPDSIKPPTIIPLRGQPKVIPAHPNVHPLKTPEVVQLPKDIKVLTIGKDIPLPKTVPTKGRKIPVSHPKPIPIESFRTKESAIYPIQFLSEDQGLKTPVITSLLEDSRGRIWFGTAASEDGVFYGGGGAFMYDGNNLFHFTQKEGFNLQSIPDIMEDSKGNIWFLGLGSICYYDGNHFVYFSDEEGLINKYITAITEDRQGNIWLGGKEIYRFDGNNFTIFDKAHGLDNEYILGEDNDVFSFNINALLEDSRGHLWWATQGSGVLRYDGQTIAFLSTKEGLVDNYIESILEDSKGRIWLGSGGTGNTGRGVSCFTPNLSPSSSELSGSITNFTNEHGLIGFRITSMLEDQSGDIWLATFNNGVSRFDGNKFTQYTKEEGLNFNAALCLEEDTYGNIWVGTKGGGISRIQPNSFMHFTEKQGLSKQWINTIFEDSKGNIWLGTAFGGALKYDGQNFTHYTEAEGLTHNYVLSFMEDSKGNIWMTTPYNGVSCFDGKVFKNYTSKQGLSFNFVGDSHEDQEGNLWFSCGFFGGITRLNPDTGQFTHFTGQKEEGKVKHLIGGGHLYEDGNHDLWFGGAGWVTKYDKEKDQINYAYPVDSVEKGWVLHYLEDDANLWIGTTTPKFIKIEKGPNQLAKTVTYYNAENGCPNSAVMSIINDKQNHLWLSSKEGLALSPGGIKDLVNSNNKWLHFGKEDGLKSKDFRFGSGFLDSKNRMWWGNFSAGLTMLNLNAFDYPKIAPQHLGLSSIELQGKFSAYQSLSDTVQFLTSYSNEQLAATFDSVTAFYNYPTRLELPHDINHLTFHFAAIDWSAPHKIKYSYQIEDIDEDWSNPNRESKADYRNLPYGTHTFKVKAIGAAQIWSDPFEYTFTILPPWWHTWWAYCLYAIAAIGTIGWYVQRLRRQINQKQQQLEKEQYLNQELTELNKANSRFVPHDFLQILSKTSLKDLKLGDQTATKMTILFADIRDYTTISESMTPEQNFKFINAYLGQMGPIIKNHGGFICQYFGDGIMALFKDNHAQGVQAAIEMQKTLNFYNQTRQEQGKQAIQVGIGLNTGQLMLGVIGDEDRYDSSVISDAVNTAARMEGLTKIFGCMLIISEPTLQELMLLDDFPSSSNLDSKEKAKLLDNGKLSSNRDYTYRFLGKVKVKGKKVALNIYDFYDGDPEEIRELKTTTKADFEKALHLYFDKEFGKAADLLKVVLDKYPTDKAAQYYFDKAVAYVTAGVGETWSGVEEMVSK